MKEPLEKDIQRAILAYLCITGHFAWRQNQGVIPAGPGRYRRFVGMLGLPDICGILPGGRALFIEVKRPGGKISKDQEAFLKQATLKGALAFVAYSVEDVREKLK